MTTIEIVRLLAGIIAVLGAYLFGVWAGGRQGFNRAATNPMTPAANLAFQKGLEQGRLSGEAAHRSLMSSLTLACHRNAHLAAALGKLLDPLEAVPVGSVGCTAVRALAAPMARARELLTGVTQCEWEECAELQQRTIANQREALERLLGALDCMTDPEGEIQGYPGPELDELQQAYRDVKASTFWEPSK